MTIPGRDAGRARAASIGSLLGLGILLAACSTEPFQVLPARDPANPAVPSIPPPDKVTKAFPQVPRAANLGRFDYDPRPKNLALCYSSQLNTPEQLLARAAALCPQGGQVTLIGQDVFFNNCSIFQPHRATFRCVPGPAPESKYK